MQGYFASKYIKIFEKVHFKSKISLIIGLIRFNLSFFDEVFDLSYDISVVNSRFRKSLTWVRSLMLKSEMVKRVVRFGGGEERSEGTTYNFRSVSNPPGMLQPEI